MASNDTKVPIPLGGGVDDSEDAHRLAPPHSAIVENMRPAQKGTYRKRPGATAVFAGTNTENPVLVSGEQQMLLLGDVGPRLIDATSSNKSSFGGPIPTTVSPIRISAGRGFVHSVQCACTATHTAVLYNVLGKTTPTSDPSSEAWVESDYSSVAVILDSNDKIVWGPYELPDIQFLPRIEPVSADGFMFFGMSINVGSSTSLFHNASGGKLRMVGVRGTVGSAPGPGTGYGTVWLDSAPGTGVLLYKAYDTDTTYTGSGTGVAFVAFPYENAVSGNKELKVLSTTLGPEIDSAVHAITTTSPGSGVVENRSLACYWHAATSSLAVVDLTDNLCWTFPETLGTNTTTALPALDGIRTGAAATHPVTAIQEETYPHMSTPVFFVDALGGVNLNEYPVTFTGPAPATVTFGTANDPLLPMVYEPVVAAGVTLFSYGGGGTSRQHVASGGGVDYELRGASTLEWYHMEPHSGFSSGYRPRFDLTIAETRLGTHNHKLYTHQANGRQDSPCVTGQVGITSEGFLVPHSILTSLQKDRGNALTDYLLLRELPSETKGEVGAITDGAGYYNDEQIVTLSRVKTAAATYSDQPYEGGQLVAAGLVSLWSKDLIHPCALRKARIGTVAAGETPTTSNGRMVATDAVGILDASTGSFSTNNVVYNSFYYVKIVLVFTDADGLEFRSAPSERFLVEGLSTSEDTPPPLCPVVEVVPHPQALAFFDASRALDVEIYVTARTAEPTITQESDIDESTYTMVNRMPLQYDSDGYFVIDTMQDFVRYDSTPSAPDDTWAPGWMSPPHTTALYTLSNELPPDHPPAMHVVAHAGEYLFGIAAEDPFELWVSKPLVKGRGPEWSSALTLLLPPDSGGCVSLAGTYDRIYALCKNGVWEMPAIGGFSSIGGGSFPPFRLTYQGDPCVTHMGTVRTPQGTLYVSADGPRLIGQSGEVEPIGSKVRYQLDWANCRDSVFIAKDQEVLWFGVNGYVALDLKVGAWSYGTLGALSAGQLGGELARIRPDGQVMLQVEGIPLDGTETFLGRVVSPWLEFGDVVGFKRVVRAMLLGRIENKPTDGELQVTLSYNYDDTIVDTFVWTVAEIDALAYKLQLMVGPSQQKLESIKIGIQELRGVGEVSNLDWSLTGMALKVRQKNGLMKLQAGARK